MAAGDGKAISDIEERENLGGGQNRNSKTERKLDEAICLQKLVFFAQIVYVYVKG